jgi:hypothetical protein
MAVSNQNSPIGGQLDPWNSTTSAVETLAGAGMQAGEQIAQKLADNTEIRAMWFAATEQTWFLVAGHFRNRAQKPSSYEQSKERIASSSTVETFGGQISFAATGSDEAEKKWKVTRLEAVRARIAAAPNVKERLKRQLATQQQEQERTHHAQEAKATIEEAERIENNPTGRRMDHSPYYLAISRIKIAEAKRKEAQQKQPVVAKGRTAQGPGNVASRQHADKSAGFAGAAGE